MMADYYKTLSKRVITRTGDSQGGFTETLTDTDFEGFIAVLSGNELVRREQMGLGAVAQLNTDDTISVKDRVIDVTGYFSQAGTVFEVVYAYTNPFSTYYDLKII